MTTVYNVNSYSFSELTEEDDQVSVTNTLGRLAKTREIVSLDGYIGEIMEADGIADTATGRINICNERTVRTAQIEVTDTFVVGQTVYFLSGGSGAAGKIRSANITGSVPYGKCTGFGGTSGAHTYVEVRPFSQGSEIPIGSSVAVAAALKVVEIAVPAGSHAAGAPVVSLGIPVGSKIVDVIVRATATVASGTVTISDGTNAITNAIAMDTLDVVSRVASIDTTYSTVISAGLTLTANGATDEGIVHVTYI